MGRGRCRRVAVGGCSSARPQEAAFFLFPSEASLRPAPRRCPPFCSSSSSANHCIPIIPSIAGASPRCPVPSAHDPARRPPRARHFSPIHHARVIQPRPVFPAHTTRPAPPAGGLATNPASAGGRTSRPGTGPAGAGCTAAQLLLPPRHHQAHRSHRGQQRWLGRRVGRRGAALPRAKDPPLHAAAALLARVRRPALLGLHPVLHRVVGARPRPVGAGRQAVRRRGRADRRLWRARGALHLARLRAAVRERHGDGEREHGRAAVQEPSDHLVLLASLDALAARLSLGGPPPRLRLEPPRAQRGARPRPRVHRVRPARADARGRPRPDPPDHRPVLRLCQPAPPHRVAGRPAQGRGEDGRRVRDAVCRGLWARHGIARGNGRGARRAERAGLSRASRAEQSERLGGRAILRRPEEGVRRAATRQALTAMRAWGGARRDRQGERATSVVDKTGARARALRTCM